VRVTVALVLSVLAIAGAVLYASESQRKVAEENYHEAIVARQLAADMLSRENALQQYFADARPQTLFPVYELDRRQDAALAEATELSSDSAEELATIARQSAAEDRWDALATKEIAARDGGQGAPSAAQRARRDAIVKDFLGANREYQRSLDSRRVEELKAAAIVPVKLLFALSVLFGAIALAFVVRRRRTLARSRALETAHETADRHYAADQARFGEAMQVAENQSEGHELLIRHLEAGTPDASITVLIRNNSGDRLEPRCRAAGGLAARRAARAGEAAQLPRRAPQPPGRPGPQQ
jgi:hypothetical protein